MLFVNLQSFSNFERKVLSESVKAVCLEVNFVRAIRLKYFHVTEVAGVAQDCFNSSKLKNYSDTGKFFFSCCRYSFKILNYIFLPTSAPNF